MMPAHRLLAALSLFLASAPALAADSPLEEVEALEAQNREMLKALKDLKGRITSAPPVPPAPAPTIPRTIAIGESSTLKFSGFLRADVIMDTAAMNSTIVPFYVRSPDSGASAAQRARPDEGAFSIDPRLTRLVMEFDGGTPPSLAYAKLTGRLETDFDTSNSGPSTESRQVPRIREAFMRLAWPNDWTVTAGQAWV